jgi:hypothetical protein
MVNKLRFFVWFVLCLFIAHDVNATIYTTTSNNSWSPSKPSNSLSSSDEFIINHTVTLKGITLLNGGSITINSGGKLSIKWSANFNAGSSVFIAGGGELKLTQLTTSNSSSDFVIDGIINTSNGTFVNTASGVIDFNEGATWTLNQQSLANYGDMNLLDDISWKNGSVGFFTGEVLINGHLSIKNLSLSNTGSIVGVGQIEVESGNGTFASPGDINGCTGNSCIPPSTIGSTTYLSYHTTTPGNTFVPYSGGNLSGTTCSSTVQVLSDLNITNDIVVGDLVVSPGVKVTIEPGSSLSICDKIINEGEFEISNSGSLVQTSVNDLNEGDGLYTVTRDGSNNPLAFNAWSSPVESTSILGVFNSTNPCDIYCFEGSTQSWKYDYVAGFSTSCNGNPVVFDASIVIANGDGMMDKGRGYFVPGEAMISRDFEGQVNNGTIPIDVHGTNFGHQTNWDMDDWNLLGNPYASAIDLGEFFAQNNSVVTGDFYFWVDDNSNGSTYNQSNDYAVYNNFSAVSANGSKLPTQFVPTGQGFWVYAIQDGTVNFNNSIRVTGNNSSIFKTEVEKVVVRIEVTNDSNNFNQTAIGFTDNATNGYDMSLDALKGISDVGLSVGSMIDSSVYAIQAFEPVANFTDYTTMLFIKTNSPGSHVFSVNSFENVGEHMNIYLRDNAISSNGLTDLKQSDYTVYLDTGVYDSRFEIIFENTGAPNSVVDITKEENRFQVYQSDENFVFKSDEAIQNISVFDILGKELVNVQGVNQANYLMSASFANNGAYVVQITFENGSIETQKIVYFE